MKIRMKKKGMLTYQHGSLKLILSIVFLHAQLQQQLHIVLQTSFGEHEKEIFSNFAIIHDMTAAADQQPRPMHEEVEKGILHLTIAGSMERTSFWPHLQEMNPGIVSSRKQYKGGGDRFEQAD